MTFNPQALLPDFFALTKGRQAAGLAKLLRLVRDETTVESIEWASYAGLVQDQLVEGVRHIFTLPVQTAAGDLIEPGWAGGFTAVQLDSHGYIVAAARNPVGDVYRVHGKNLYGYALAKAIIELFLANYERDGGILSDSNYGFLASHVPDRSLLSVGAWVRPKPWAVFGISGAEAGPAYTAAFGPGMTPSTDKARVNFAAGAADVVLAAGLAQYVNKTRRMQVVIEPDIVNVGRLLH